MKGTTSKLDEMALPQEAKAHQRTYQVPRPFCISCYISTKKDSSSSTNSVKHEILRMGTYNTVKPYEHKTLKGTTITTFDIEFYLQGFEKSD